MPASNHLRSAFRIFTAVAFMTTGAAHFLRPGMFVRIVPPVFPQPLLLVRISGGCEIAGALGLLIPHCRKQAAWGLIALLIAVFPANVYMAVKPERFTDLHLPAWLLWFRLPLQAIFIAGVWWVGQKPQPAEMNTLIQRV